MAAYSGDHSGLLAVPQAACLYGHYSADLQDDSAVHYSAGARCSVDRADDSVARYLAPAYSMGVQRSRADWVADYFVERYFDFAERYFAAASDDSCSAAALGDSQYPAAELSPDAQAEPSLPEPQPWPVVEVPLGEFAKLAEPARHFDGSAPAAAQPAVVAAVAGFSRQPHESQLAVADALVSVCRLPQKLGARGEAPVSWP